MTLSLPGKQHKSWGNLTLRNSIRELRRKITLRTNFISLMGANDLKANGIYQENLMDLVFCFILMGQSMKESSSLESKRATGESFTRMETFTMESGLMIERMDMGFLKMLQELAMKGNGKWISNTAVERKSLKKRAQFMRETSLRDRNMVKESLNGRTDPTIREISSKGNTKVEAYIILLTKVGSMKEIFSTIRCMDTERKHGQTVENTKEITVTQRRMDSGPSFGLMETCIKATGVMISKTEREFTSMLKKALNVGANGPKENVQSGQKKLR